MFNLIHNKVYFDKYEYEKIDFENVAFFSSDCKYLGMVGITSLVLLVEMQLPEKKTLK